jgi:hypothetical protein
LMRRWEQVKAGDGAVVLIGGEPGNREIAPRAAAHHVAEARHCRPRCEAVTTKGRRCQPRLNRARASAGIMLAAR